MSKYSWKEDYWNKETPPWHNQRVPSIPPRPAPLVAVPLLPRKSQPQYAGYILTIAVGFCLCGAVMIWLVSP